MNWIKQILAALFSGTTKPQLPVQKEPLKKYSEEVDLSPNKGGKIEPRFIILHHSDGSFKGGVSWIKNPASRVSYHYMIDSTGARVQFVWDSMRAWHAGRSIWGKVEGLNSCSIGIAFFGNTNERSPNFVEIDSCAEKCIYLMDKFGIPLANILSHRQISPGRKDDPSDEVMMRVFERIKERKSHDLS